MKRYPDFTGLLAKTSAGLYDPDCWRHSLGHCLDPTPDARLIPHAGVGGQLNALNRLLAWYALMPSNLTAGEARTFSGDMIGYSAWMIVQAVSIVIFLQIGQTVLAAYGVVSVLLIAFCFYCPLSGRPALFTQLRQDGFELPDEVGSCLVAQSAFVDGQ